LHLAQRKLTEPVASSRQLALFKVHFADCKH